jgi:hypothetical protein
MSRIRLIHDDPGNLKFSTCMTYRRENFDEKTEFINAIHYELYDENKVYEKEPFIHDYGFGDRRYINSLHTIRIADDNVLRYVVVEEKISKEDLDRISPFCRCFVCTARWYNISRFITCPCCIGCLKTRNPSQHQIDKTRDYISEKNLL